MCRDRWRTLECSPSARERVDPVAEGRRIAGPAGDPVDKGRSTLPHAARLGPTGRAGVAADVRRWRRPRLREHRRACGIRGGRLRDLPLADAYCQFAIEKSASRSRSRTGARTPPASRNLRSTTELGVVAYLGVSAHPWRQADRNSVRDRQRSRVPGPSVTSPVVEELAATVMAYVESRPAQHDTAPRWASTSRLSPRARRGSQPTRCANGSGVTACCGRNEHPAANAATTTTTWLGWSGSATGSAKASGSPKRRPCSTLSTRRCSPSTDEVREAVVDATRPPQIRPPRLTALVEQAFALHQTEEAIEEIVRPRAPSRSAPSGPPTQRRGSPRSTC